MKLFLMFILLIMQTHKQQNAFCDQAQACLNKMYEDKHYHYLEGSNLILVKTDFTKNCTNLHFGTKKIILLNIAPSSIKKYASKKDVVNNERHLIIAPMTNKPDVELFVRLANVNQTLVCKLKKDANWTAAIINRSIE